VRKCLTCNKEYDPDQHNIYTSMGYCSTYCYGNSKYYAMANDICKLILDRMSYLEKMELYSIYDFVDFNNLFDAALLDWYKKHK
jgi:hypothetical protein